MSDNSPSLSSTVLGYTSASTGTSAWLPFCVGTATGAVLFGGALLAWQCVSHKSKPEDEITTGGDNPDRNESFGGDNTFNTNNMNNQFFTPATPTYHHLVPQSMEDTILVTLRRGPQTFEDATTPVTLQRGLPSLEDTTPVHRHRGSQELDDTLNNTATYSLTTTPSLAVRPDGNQMRDAQEQGTSDTNPDNKSLLNLLYNIAQEQARKEGYIHRGISCNICDTTPLCGIRYKCASCVDYDICERCEPLDTHNKTHTFLKIRIPIPPLANPRSVLVKPFYTGAETSTKELNWEDFTRLQASTYFCRNEIEALYHQYQALCTNRHGITREVYDQCLGPLGLEKNLVLDRLFKFYDFNGDGYIDFEEFINGLSVLVKGSQEEKIAYTFEGYDLDGEGAISRDNLRQMFKAYFYITIELVRDVVKACEEEMMANFDDTQGRPVSSLFSAPIPADTGGAPNASGKVPFPGNPGSREDMWPVMEAMSQDAIEEMVENVFKMAQIDPTQRITLEQFRELAVIDSSLIAWFDALGTVF